MDAAMPMNPIIPSPEPLGADGERHLLEAFRHSGDRAAMSRLLLAHAADAYRLARRLAGNAADAEDIVQDAFLRCMVYASGYRGDGPVRSWIMTIVGNAARQHATAAMRRQRREERVAKEAPVEHHEHPDAELHERLTSALDALPPDYRLPVAMRYLDGLPFSDIAAALQAKEKSVRTRVERGLERLRKILSRRGVAATSSGIVAAFAAAPACEIPASLGPLVEQAVLKGAAAGASVTAGATVWTIKGVLLMGSMAAALSLGGYLTWLQWPKPFPIDRSAFAGNQEGDEQLVEALDQPVSLSVNGPLEEVLFRLRAALPAAQRFRFTAPDALFADLHRIGGGGGATHVTGGLDKQAIQVQADRQPLREVLDALCVDQKLRWIRIGDAIVIDRPLPVEERERLIQAFAAAHDVTTIAETAHALATSADSGCLRPLLLSLAEPGQRADLVATQLEPLVNPQRGTYSAMALAMDAEDCPSPLIAFAEDHEAGEAVLKAIGRQQEARAVIIQVGGHLRLRAIVEGCIGLVRDGLAPAPALESIIRRRILRDNLPDTLGRASASALGWIGDDRAVQPLIEVLSDKRYPYQPNDAVIGALGRLRDPRAIMPLLAIATDKTRWGPQRGECILALGRLGDARAVEPLGVILLDAGDDRDWVCGSVPRALASIGSPRAVEILCSAAAALKDDDGPRHDAIGELGFIGGERVEQELLKILPRYFSGEYAATALGRIRNPALVPKLRGMLRTAKDEDAYGHIAAALARMRLPIAETALIETIPDPSDKLFFYHVRALGGSPESARALLALVDHGQPAAQRRAAATEVARCGTDGVKRALDLIMTDDDLEVRLAAMEGFRGFIRNEDVLPRTTIAAWLAHPDEHIRAKAVELVVNQSQVGSDTGVKTRIAALDDQSAIVRREAVRYHFFGMDNQQSQVVLARYLKALAGDPDPEVRSLIAGQCFLWPLPDLPDQTYTDLADALLAAAESDSQARVRAMAGQTLARLIHALRKNTKGPNLSAQLRELTARAAMESDGQARAIINEALATPAAYLNVKFTWHDQEAPSEAGAKDF